MSTTLSAPPPPPPPPPPGPTPLPPVESPPPVYTPRAPAMPFVVVEDPPPYSPKQGREGDATARARRGEGRVCGVRTVKLVAVLALLVAVGVIAGGVYGYQHRGSSSSNNTDPDIVAATDPAFDSDGTGMGTGYYVGTVGR